ncbi:MAG: hypothetical protein ACM3WV_03745 [Bacillota bacterium]
MVWWIGCRLLLHREHFVRPKHPGLAPNFHVLRLVSPVSQDGTKWREARKPLTPSILGTAASGLPCLAP